MPPKLNSITQAQGAFSNCGPGIVRQPLNTIFNTDTDIAMPGLVRAFLQLQRTWLHSYLRFPECRMPPRRAWHDMLE